MQNVNSHYYICTKGHVTVGPSDRKTKCSQKIQQVKLVKKGKAGVEKEVLKEGTCEEKIVQTEKIPAELNLFERWDYNIVRAFMTSQTPENLKIKFIQCLQEHFTKLNERIASMEKNEEEN